MRETRAWVGAGTSTCGSSRKKEGTLKHGLCVPALTNTTRTLSLSGPCKAPTPPACALQRPMGQFARFTTHLVRQSEGVEPALSDSRRCFDRSHQVPSQRPASVHPGPAPALRFRSCCRHGPRVTSFVEKAAAVHRPRLIIS